MDKRRRRLFEPGILQSGVQVEDLDESSDDSTAGAGTSQSLRAIPPDILTRIDHFTDPKTRLHSFLATKFMQDPVQTRSSSDDLLCLFVLKLFARLDPKTNNWEGSPNRAAYWWIGRHAVLRGPSNNPPKGISRKPGDLEIVQRFCLNKGYTDRCLAFTKAPRAAVACNDLEEFIERLNTFSGSGLVDALAKIPDICIAGGSVIGCLVNAPSSDIDVFFTCDPGEADKRLQSVFEAIQLQLLRRRGSSHARMLVARTVHRFFYIGHGSIADSSYERSPPHAGGNEMWSIPFFLHP